MGKVAPYLATSNGYQATGTINATLAQAQAAEQSGSAALELATRLNEKATEAQSHEWLGRVAAARGDHETTDAEFSLAIAQLTKLNFVERLIRTHATYAQILEDRGDLQAANQHLRQLVSLNRPDIIAESSLEERRRELA